MKYSGLNKRLFLKNRRLFSLLFAAFLYMQAAAQQVSPNSLRNQLAATREDTVRMRLLKKLGEYYIFRKPDTSIILYNQALVIARNYKLTGQESILLARLSGAFSFNPKKRDSATLYMQQAIGLARQYKLREEEIECFQVLTSEYFINWQNPDSAILLARQGIALAEEYKLPAKQLELINMLRAEYNKFNKPDSAFRTLFDGVILARQNKLLDKETQFLANIKYKIIRSGADTSLFLSRMAIDWARSLHEKKYEGLFLSDIGSKYFYTGNYAEALKDMLQSLEIFQELGDQREMAATLNLIGIIYTRQGEYQQSLNYLLRSRDIQERIHDSTIMYNYEFIGNNYAKLKMTDSAIYFAEKSYREAERVGAGYIEGGLLDDLGEIYAEMGQDSLAMDYFRRSLPDILATGSDLSNQCEVYLGMAKLFKKAGLNDSCIYYARKALPLAQTDHLLNFVYESSIIITDFYKTHHRIDSAFHYQEIAIAANDSLFSQEKVKEMQTIGFNEQLRQQQAKEAETKYRNRINLYMLLAGITVLIVVAGMLFRNNRHKQKAFTLLQKQKGETDVQRSKAEKALDNLKAAQSQLIQSEKMASLGELTAGIAHEIQNPLNFVNNFSEVTNELLDEMKAAFAEGNEQEAIIIANDVKQNLEKILHHGRRADTIVKGMLQHSRSSSGVKEPTDINALADEYLRLSYHGLRAKDKSFNSTLDTNFDTSLPKLNIIPQDIGRVLLNLYNNAFYAVTDQKKQKGDHYEPTVTVKTKKVNNTAEISVRDNGNGIPSPLLNKIFQPFFTTKPTGQGTGLGLSLSYDIIKAHGGELKAKTKEGEFAEFIICLPAG
jgi:two-component system, NtrC family, sensor kinase